MPLNYPSLIVQFLAFGFLLTAGAVISVFILDLFFMNVRG